MGRYCRCEHDPYSSVDWDIEVEDPDRAFCKSCELDLRPETARRWWAIANARAREEERNTGPADAAWGDTDTGTDEFIDRAKRMFPGSVELGEGER